MTKQKQSLSRFYGILILTAYLSSCDTHYVDITKNAAEGYLIDFRQAEIYHYPGWREPYQVDITMKAPVRGSISKILVYKTFHGKEMVVNGADKDSTLYYSSDTKALLQEITAEDLGGMEDYPLVFSFKDLVADLMIDGMPMQNSENGMNIGDYFELTFVVEDHNEKVIAQQSHKKVKITMGHLGGLYEMTDWYINIIEREWHDIRTFAWQVEILPITTTTYRIMGNAIYSVDFNPDNEFYFNLNPETLRLSIPKYYDGKLQTVFGDDEVINCEDDPDLFWDSACDKSNNQFQFNDDQFSIALTHGFISISSTSWWPVQHYRFWYELEKIADLSDPEGL